MQDRLRNTISMQFNIMKVNSFKTKDSLTLKSQETTEIEAKIKENNEEALMNWKML